MHDIKRKAIRGGLAKLCGQAATSLLRLGFIAVLARLLEPGDFGLFAMVTVITTFLELFSTVGLSAASIQRATITDEQMSTLFWVNILIGVSLASICFAIAPLLVTFYSEPRLFWVTCAMGGACLFRLAGLQHNALLQRQLHYVALTAIEVCSHITSLCVGISLAFSGYGYWALVGAAVTLQATMTTCMWIVTRWIPGRPHWDTETHSMLRFGGTAILNGVITYVAYNLDKVLVGRVWGAQALGYYGAAAQLIAVPTSNLHAAVGGVMFSTLSRVQHDLERYRSVFLKGYTLVISMTVPVTVFAAMFADDIVLVFLGPKWTNAIDIFRLLTPTILVFGIIDPLGWLLWSSGQHVRSLKLALVIAVLVITAYFVGLPYGPKGVAFAFSAAMVVWLVPHVFWCLHGSTISAWELFRLAGRPLLAAAAAVAIGLTAQYYFGAVESPVMSLLVEGGTMVVAYLAILLFVMGQKDFYLELLRAIGKSSSQSSDANNLEKAS